MRESAAPSEAPRTPGAEAGAGAEGGDARGSGLPASAASGEPAEALRSVPRRARGLRPVQSAGGGAGPLRVPDRGVGTWTKLVTCRYHLHGSCKQGEKCRYSHDLSGRQPASQGPDSGLRDPADGGPSAAAEVEASTPEVAGASPGTSGHNLPLIGSAFETESGNAGGQAAGAVAATWADAVEFVPGQPYRGRLALPAPQASARISVAPEEPLCQYAAVGECPDGENCMYLHGEVCDMCGLQALHPVNEAQRAEHVRACIEAHERNMEFSFAVQSSMDKVCGICMEIVYEKPSAGLRRFGILSNCNHSYCLRCIRVWRKATQFQNRVVKSCPQCRVTSHLVIPSEFWVEDEAKKKQLIKDYKKAMSKKPCRYFMESRDRCPFGNHCFYRHVNPERQREESQKQDAGTSSTYWNQLVEGSVSFKINEKELIRLRLAKVLFKYLLSTGNYKVPFSDYQWELLLFELEKYFNLIP
ncbi:probable E3 ubiquitin-protein ligase makorin-3 [Loxodonta africana]|uniref:probable E3 ubiquitin-protein ligase makorin-3 n=1 Tax=Loxodonta africana TaxID=9785 RepID=UPI0030D0A48F